MESNGWNSTHLNVAGPFSPPVVIPRSPTGGGLVRSLLGFATADAGGFCERRTGEGHRSSEHSLLAVLQMLLAPRGVLFGIGPRVGI